MPVTTKTLGAILNAALKEIGEPEIAEISTTNILQLRLVEVANNAVREMVESVDHDWRLKRTTLVTTADITDEYAAVTNGSTSVTSVDEDGVAADNWGDASALMYFRVGTDQTSYQVASVDTSGSPDELTLETAYLGTTSTAIGYRLFQDTYAITAADFGELDTAAYGDGGQLVLKTLPELVQLAGGDRHRDTSGRPKVIAQIGPDSSNNEQFVLWPYPSTSYLIEIWYLAEFDASTAFTATLFGDNAPMSAYDFVEHKVVAAAHEWDHNLTSASTYEQRAQVAMANVIRRENRDRMDVGFNVETYRRSYGIRYPVQSSIWFDTYQRRE